MVKKKSGKKFDLKDEYRKSWDYIKKIKNFIYIVVILFFIFAFIGFFIPTPQFLSEQILRFIEELLEKTSQMTHQELVRFILFNNLKSSFFGMLFGIFLGIFPIISIIANGYLLGFVGFISVQAEGASILLRILPHGIFELPAVFISLAMGLKLGTFIFQKNQKKSFVDYFWNSLRVFLFIVVPLLVVAAIIEGALIFIFK